ncbi:protein-glutamine gamma-glutamyltransferase E-like [Brachionichthys hirsutus]|uniref:protein-glutamine gamma-glutamyltransferase E-like n=1 Tax=Brachionichthys hirsutus TaxID=412623 RepID=UPI0036049863
MAAGKSGTVFKEVSLNTILNNVDHHTDEISVKDLIVRRGFPFKLGLVLRQPPGPHQSVVITATTGTLPSEDLGTKSIFGIGPDAKPSPSAKAVWKAELDLFSNLQQGILSFAITPPADAPIGKYTLVVKHRAEETTLPPLVLLFNPWCPDDSVFLSSLPKINEYVMNEAGKVYYGSSNYICDMDWIFGQFEELMVEICLELLDRNVQHKNDPSADVAARCDPVYVGRVISAMINVQEDDGVLVGNWSGDFRGGTAPTHWLGSSPILKEWFQNGFKPVKYGQCWVFASVMCSVMRCLGIPTRVITNFNSAHDTDGNLSIDKFCNEDGAELKMGGDSIWNFHVWCESWMKRPDLAEDGIYGGWQVLDPTPQETSGGIHCCGPASLKAILKGQVDTEYDVPFVFAEVNADIVTWEVKADGSLVSVKHDPKKVGRSITTKKVSSDQRRDVTNRYKHKEGTTKERSAFEYAISRDYTTDADRVDVVDEDESADEGEGAVVDSTEVTEEIQPEKPPMTIEFQEVTMPKNGEDVSMQLLLHSETASAIQLRIKISVQAMRYNDQPDALIQKDAREETLHPGKDLCIPILVPFLDYHDPMLKSGYMKISALIEDKLSEENVYFAEDDVVLLDPPLRITVNDGARVGQLTSGTLIFKNTIPKPLQDCTLTLFGNDLYDKGQECRIGTLLPGSEVTVHFDFIPRKPGKKTLVADFDSENLKDVKSSCKVDVLP